MNETRAELLESRRRLKAEYGELFDALAALLFKHDPIGMIFEVTRTPMSMSQKQGPSSQGCEVVILQTTYRSWCTVSLFAGLAKIRLARKSITRKQLQRFGNSGSNISQNCLGLELRYFSTTTVASRPCLFWKESSCLCALLHETQSTFGRAAQGEIIRHGPGKRGYR